MRDMYNMKDTSQMHSSCPMMNCPMMVMQPMNINPMMYSIPNCMNHSLSRNMYDTVPMSFQQMQMYGTPYMSGSTVDPYFFQIEMKPVLIEEITD